MVSLYLVFSNPSSCRGFCSSLRFETDLNGYYLRAIIHMQQRGGLCSPNCWNIMDDNLESQQSIIATSEVISKLKECVYYYCTQSRLQVYCRNWN